VCFAVSQSWLERYFILFEDGVLGYYTSDKMEVKQVRARAAYFMGCVSPRALTKLLARTEFCIPFLQLFEKRGKLKVKGSKLQDFERGAVIQRDGYVFGLTSSAARTLACCRFRTTSPSRVVVPALRCRRSLVHHGGAHVRRARRVDEHLCGQSHSSTLLPAAVRRWLPLLFDCFVCATIG
jgi:hypothetical protein